MSIGLILVIILVIFLFGGFSGRFGGYGYGYGHGGVGVIGIILIIIVVLMLLGRIGNGYACTEWCGSHVIPLRNARSIPQALGSANLSLSEFRFSALTFLYLEY